MRLSALVVLCVLTASPQYVFAQQKGDGLNEQQRLGRRILAQSCGVCHLPPAHSAPTFGPPLNKTSSAGDDSVMRLFILEGTPRMPAFKYFLQSEEVDAIIAYVRTVSAPEPAAATAH